DTFLNTTNRQRTVHVAFGGETGYSGSSPDSTTIGGSQSGDTPGRATNGRGGVAPPAPPPPTANAPTRGGPLPARPRSAGTGHLPPRHLRRALRHRRPRGELLGLRLDPRARPGRGEVAAPLRGCRHARDRGHGREHAHGADRTGDRARSDPRSDRA